jgi:hypothetical protein
MTSQEYTQWLKGFLDAINGYDISKRQFDTIREKLKEVDDTIIGTPIGNGWGSPNWGGIVTIPTTTPYSIPLTGTITTGGTLTTSSYPSGSTVTYTTGNGGGAYSLTGNTTTTSAYINQNDDGDEKLLLD